MAFISNSEIGKVKILARDVTAMKGTLTKGSKVEITGVSQRGYDIKDIESGEEFIEVSTIWDNSPLFEES